MKTEVSRRAAAALLLILPLFGACQKKGPPGGEQTGMNAQPAPPPDSATAMNDTAKAGGAPAAPALTDANIMALLDEANKADSSAGAVAAKKATNPGVKSFAREMMIDHHKLRAEGAKLAKKLNLTPAAPANDPVAAGAQDETTAIQSAPKGPEFDRTYVEKEVTAHQSVKDLLDQAHGATQNDQIKALIEKAKPIVQQHLDHVQKLQSDLTKSA